VTADAVRGFLDRVDEHQRALEDYTPRDNTILRDCVDELLERISRGDAPPTRLDAPALGSLVEE
jgi:hypothetical protein